MSDIGPIETDAQRIIGDAIEDARDRSIDAERLESIRQLLLTNAEARRHYLEYNRLSHLLALAETKLGDDANARSAGEGSHRAVARVTKPILRGPVFGATAAALVIALVITIAVKNSDPRIEQTHVIASLSQVDGDVMVTSVDAESRIAQPGTDVLSGDTIRTVGTLGSAVLTYCDGTRLLIVGNTSVTCADDGQKSVVVHGGTLSASVAGQPMDAPMLLATPKDRVEVVGTKFVLEAKADETEISVNQGLVKLTRLSDGRTVEVPAGRRVISTAESALTLQDIPAAPVDWSVDFEDGLPPNWQAGKLVTDNLPIGSRAAVKAARVSQEGRVLFNIVAASNWAYGLFTIHEDSHLNFTVKMDQPGWIDIIICTRAVGGDPPPFSSNYIFNERGWWPDEPGRWATVSIPLKRFRRAAFDPVPIDRVVPFSLLFSSPEDDRKLVIDRIWITRGGPGVVQTQDEQ